MIKLSIIIPVYNVEKYIKKCLDSIFMQDAISSEYEVIVVDDGTPDNSMEVVENFAKYYPNLIIIHQENQGLSSARNSGLKVAQGEYVWFVDSDDWIEKNCLNELFEFFAAYQAEVFVTPLKSINESNGDVYANMFSDHDKQIKFASGIDFLKNGIKVVPVQIYIFKRYFLEKHDLKFMHGVFHEDNEFVPRMLYFATTVCLINSLFYNYLVRESGSITSEFSIKKSEDLILIIKSLADFSAVNNLKSKDKYNVKFKKIGCLYLLLSNLNNTKDTAIQNVFIKKHYWFIKRLSIESIFTFYPRFSFYGLLLLIDYRLLSLYINSK
jgi:glycosyltransferase involved in cell wall biosynthesis